MGFRDGGSLAGFQGSSLRGTSRVARYLEGVRWAWEQQMNQSLLMAMGRPGDQLQSWREVLGLWTAQGGFQRQATVEARGFIRYAPSLAASSFHCTLYLQVGLIHGPSGSSPARWGAGGGAAGLLP